MSETASLLVDRYELGKVIGRGGMAEVHMGRDLRLGRTVAIKILRADLARDPAFQARFRREAQSAASLNHPTIVAVYDTGEETVNGMPVPFIVMEYVEGSTLRDLLSSGKRLLPVRAMEVTASVLTALEYSHRQGIVHRDIKPGNVMLTTDGRVKVMDFGIARALADTGAMTQTAAVMGTAQYLSPEQAKGEQVDTRSDLYSTGCLLYELLTGQPPFTGDSPVSVAYQHVREQPRPPSQLDPEVPAAADAVTLKALEKNRDQRYQSAAEFRTDLEQVIRGNEPVTVVLPAVGAAGAGGIAAAATTTALPAYGSGAVPAGATAVMGAGPAGVPTSPGYTAMPAPKGGKGGMGGVIFAVLAALAVVGLVIFLITQGNKSTNTPGATTTSSNNTAATPQKVPNVVNRNISDALSVLNNAGWQVGDQQTKSSSQFASGVVMSQNPGAGESALKSVKINLVISSGDPKGTLQDLTGKTRAEAVNYLKTFNANVIVHSEASEKAKDTVLRTSPEAGSSVTSGTQVELWVANGNNTLPSVVGQTPDQAQQTLNNAGFTKVRVNETTASSGGQTDVVTGMDPNPGSETALSTQITLTVPVADDSNGNGNNGNGNGNGNNGGGNNNGTDNPPPTSPSSTPSSSTPNPPPDDHNIPSNP